jgi:hypothetical protein
MVKRQLGISVEVKNLVLEVQSHTQLNRIPKRSPYRNVASILWSGM